MLLARSFAVGLKRNAREDVGFAYGALAAGSDILIAELLLDRRARGAHEQFFVHAGHRICDCRIWTRNCRQSDLYGGVACHLGEWGGLHLAACG